VRLSKLLIFYFLSTSNLLNFSSLLSILLHIFCSDFFCLSIRDMHSSSISRKLDPKYFLNRFLKLSTPLFVKTFFSIDLYSFSRA